MKTLTFIICTFLCPGILLSQKIIDVAQRTITLGANKTEELFFGFAAGDQIVFNLSEEDRKALKEIEVLEYPYNSKFLVFETAEIENKTLNIFTTAVYRFRFYNEAKTSRKCAIKIQRIPASEETEAFNTNIVWRTQYDTSYYTDQEKYVRKQEYMSQKVIPLTFALVNGNNALFSETKSRIVFPIQLPEHTVEWYYRVAFSNNIKGESENSIDLGEELTTLMEQTEGIKFGPSQLKQVSGEAYCDVYVMDSENAIRFQAMKDFKYSLMGSSRHIKSGITKVYGGSSVPLYLGINNVEPGNAANILLECVAIVLKEKEDIRTVEKMNVVSRVVPGLNLESNISWAY